MPQVIMITPEQYRLLFSNVAIDSVALGTVIASGLLPPDDMDTLTAVCPDCDMPLLEKMMWGSVAMLAVYLVAKLILK